MARRGGGVSEFWFGERFLHELVEPTFDPCEAFSTKFILSEFYPRRLPLPTTFQRQSSRVRVRLNPEVLVPLRRPCKSLSSHRRFLSLNVTPPRTSNRRNHIPRIATQSFRLLLAFHSFKPALRWTETW